MFGSQSGGGSLSIDGQQCHFEPDRVVHGDRPGCHGVHEPLHARHLVIKVWQLCHHAAPPLPWRALAIWLGEALRGRPFGMVWLVVVRPVESSLTSSQTKTFGAQEACAVTAGK
ncbi:MAG: hypothetical protein ACYCY2_15940 [Acidithiobacillus ferriphilus]